LVMIIGLYLRWRIMFYVMLTGAVLGLIGSIGSLTFAGQSLPGLIGGMVGVGLSFANAVLMIKLGQEFRVQQRVRLTLALDPGPKAGIDYLVRGRAYAANKMWALSAIHFRQAAGLMTTDINGLAGVAQTTAQLGDMELAQWALENALERRPDNDRVRRALASLQGKRE
ncbi:MAG: efflux RND transporter permease subunit, partial [Anaerolineae bacterium]|nr:efflux RND transporter permease subunit [Anaerolineae bacterium]